MDQNEELNIIARICNDILLKENPSPLPRLDECDWDRVFQQSSNHGVLPVIVQALEDLKTDGDTKLNLLKVKWCGASLHNQQGYYQRLVVMKGLARMFEKEGIDIMFLKGASLAQLYPKPEWRVFSDVDYYLYGSSESGIELMTQHGIENVEYHHHHTQASLNGILIENHYDFVERINHKCDILLDDALKELAQREGRSIRADFLGQDVSNAYLMTPTMNAIFLMRHMSAHFVSETIPIRMLYDWALFLKKNASEVDWRYVLPLYEQSGMMRFAEIIMTILKTRLEFECSKKIIILGEREEAEKVWSSIVNPPRQNQYAKLSLMYYLLEAKTFFSNRWKHELVYPGESFVGLLFKYVRLGIKMMLKKH